jgi:hypothetical protein
MRVQSPVSHEVGRRHKAPPHRSRVGFQVTHLRINGWQMCARDVAVGKMEVCVLFVFDVDLTKEPMELGDVFRTATP